MGEKESTPQHHLLTPDQGPQQWDPEALRGPAGK